VPVQSGFRYNDSKWFAHDSSMERFPINTPLQVTLSRQDTRF